MAAFEEALEVRKQLGIWMNPETALVMNSVGELLRQQGNLVGARSAFEEAVLSVR